MYRYLCVATCRTYSPTFALADDNNNIITVYGKANLYEVYLKYGIKNITMRQTKSGNILFGKNDCIYNHQKTYRIADAWNGVYECQSSEIGAMLARNYAAELINRGF